MTERSKFLFRASQFFAVGRSLAPLRGAYGLLVELSQQQALEMYGCVSLFPQLSPLCIQIVINCKCHM